MFVAAVCAQTAYRSLWKESAEKSIINQSLFSNFPTLQWIGHTVVHKNVTEAAQVLYMAVVFNLRMQWNNCVWPTNHRHTWRSHVKPRWKPLSWEQSADTCILDNSGLCCVIIIKTITLIQTVHGCLSHCHMVEICSSPSSSWSRLLFLLSEFHKWEKLWKNSERRKTCL